MSNVQYLQKEKIKMKVKEDFLGLLVLLPFTLKCQTQTSWDKSHVLLWYVELRFLDTKVKPYKIIVLNIEFG